MRCAAQDGFEPTETLRIGNDKHEIYGWGPILQLEALRGVLAEGLQAHFARNPLTCGGASAT